MNSASRVSKQQLRELLYPLFPLLHQIVIERKRLAERMLVAFRETRTRAASDGALPHSYEYTDTLPSLVRQAGEWSLQRREISLPFTLWTRRSWILSHRDRYAQSMIYSAQNGYNSSSPAWDWYFVQFDGGSGDLLWFGDLVEAQLLRRLKPNSGDPQDVERLRLARDLGFTYGCSANPSGLLNPRSPWLTEHMRQGDLLLEPEAVYRGILYGAVLALLALSSGCSVGELLQVRVADIQEGERHTFLLGNGSEEEQQRLPITEAVSPLLREIVIGLIHSYDEVPLVSSLHQGSRNDWLLAERYLFQWEHHVLSVSDVQTLVRFLLHGLPLSSPDGAPLRLSLDLLRDRRSAPVSNGSTTTMKERSRILEEVFGFTQSVVAGLSPASQENYSRDFYAYYLYAGSKEAALQPEKVLHWRDHLLERYKPSTVKRMGDTVESILRSAAAQGLVDQGDRMEKNLVQERSRILEEVFGFTQSVVRRITPATSEIYCCDFFAYYLYAGSKEAALQVETLRRWRDHLLREEHYKAGTVNRMIRAVESILRSAVAQGYIRTPLF